MHLLGVPVSDWTKMVSWRHVIGFHGLKDLKTNTKHKTGWWFQLLFIFTPGPYLGKWSNLTNIFHLGWNHQLEKESWCGSNSDPVTWEKAMLLHQPGFHLRPSLRLFFFRDKKNMILGPHLSANSWMYPDPNVGPLWEFPKRKPYIVDIYGVMIVHC